MPTITITEGETATFADQPWPVNSWEVRYNTSFSFGDTTPADFAPASAFPLLTSDYIGTGPDGANRPIEWSVDTADDGVSEGTETFTITFDYQYQAVEDGPFSSGTYGPITINILDNDVDICEEYFLDFDLDGRQGSGELNAGILRQEISELDQLINRDEGSLIRVDAAIEAYQQDFDQTTRDAFGDYIVALGAEEFALKAIAKVALKKTASKTIDTAYDIAEAVRDGIEFVQTGSRDKLVEFSASLVQTAGKKYGLLGPGMDLGETATTLTYLSKTREHIAELRSEQAQLSTRIEELNAETDQFRACLDEQNSHNLRVAPTISDIEFSPDAVTTQVGSYAVVDFSQSNLTVVSELQSRDIALGSDQDDDFFADSDADNIWLDGAGGFDYLVIDQSAEPFRAILDEGDAVVASGETAFVTRDVERIAFNDGTLAFDIDGVAGQTFRLYQAAFARTPDEPGLAFWIQNYDQNNVDLNSMATFFTTSEEFTQTYGNILTLSDNAYLSLLYQNVLGRSPDQEGFDFWSDAQADGVSRDDMLVYFSESAENIGLTSSIAVDGIWY